MSFDLPQLQYKYDALEPYFDEKTMEIHHTKHHQTYVDKLNETISQTPGLKNKKLEELVLLPETKNMAGGHYNHSFWWEQFSENINQQIPEIILSKKEEFTNHALKLFGSGWVWLVKNNDELSVVDLPLQDAPIKFGTPILGIDLWEHAYYLKYQNRRAEYLEAFWKVINFQKVLAKI